MMPFLTGVISQGVGNTFAAVFLVFNGSVTPVSLLSCSFSCRKHAV